LQHQRDEHKIEQLQQTVRELRWKEEVPWGDGPCLGSPRPGSLELNHLREQQQELEKIRQQLLCVAGLLTSFVNHTVDRCGHILSSPYHTHALGTDLLILRKFWSLGLF
jgi:pericentrin